MNAQNTLIVTDQEGLHMTLERITLPDGREEGRVRFPSGRQVVVPLETLTLEANGSYRLPTRFAQLEPERTETEFMAAGQVVVPIVEETLTVGARQVQTGGIRVQKTVSEREETINVPLMQESVTVERVSIGRIVEAAPPSRTEGDTLILSIVEEQIVVTKRLILQEEVRITTLRTEKPHEETVTLRREEIQIESLNSDSNTSQGEM